MARHTPAERPDAVHDAARRGFSANADGYARGRPDYPPALDGWLRDRLALGPGNAVVDLGAGTGKFIPRLATTGARIVAVEPVAAMRAALHGAYDAVDVRDGTADAIPVDDASVDAVVCAQAFHWFATKEALAEIARVLRPGGAVGLVWNVRDESVPWVKRMTDVLAPYEGDVPRYKGRWRDVFPAASFGPLEETRYRHEHVGPPDRVIIDRVMSVSFIAALPVGERAIVERRLRDLIADEPVLAGRAIVSLPYETVAFCALRD